MNFLKEIIADIVEKTQKRQTSALHNSLMFTGLLRHTPLFFIASCMCLELASQQITSHQMVKEMIPATHRMELRMPQMILLLHKVSETFYIGPVEAQCFRFKNSYMK